MCCMALETSLIYAVVWAERKWWGYSGIAITNRTIWCLCVFPLQFNHTAELHILNVISGSVYNYSRFWKWSIFFFFSSFFHFGYTWKVSNLQVSNQKGEESSATFYAVLLSTKVSLRRSGMCVSVCVRVGGCECVCVMALALSKVVLE